MLLIITWVLREFRGKEICVVSMFETSKLESFVLSFNMMWVRHKNQTFITYSILGYECSKLRNFNNFFPCIIRAWPSGFFAHRTFQVSKGDNQLNLGWIFTWSTWCPFGKTKSKFRTSKLTHLESNLIPGTSLTRCRLTGRNAAGSHSAGGADTILLNEFYHEFGLFGHPDEPDGRILLWLAGWPSRRSQKCS
jgi:hypothetical protein